MLDMITVRLLDHVLLRQHGVWGPGLALVGMSIVEQRYQAVMAVLAGDPVVDVAQKVGVSRQSVHTWLRRYAEEGLPGLQVTLLPLGASIYVCLLRVAAGARAFA